MADECLFHFAESLRTARKASGWTQAQLAQAAGIDCMSISHYEAGRREPTLTNLRWLVAALGISADVLLGRV